MTKKSKCERCGRTLATTHMKRHSNTWACRRAAFVNRLAKALPSAALPEGYLSTSSPGALVTLAEGLGLRELLHDHACLSGDQLSISVAAPAWLVGMASDLAWLGGVRSPMLKTDVCLIVRYMAANPGDAAEQVRDGLAVGRALVETMDGSYQERRAAAIALYRGVAADIMARDLDFAMSDAVLDTSCLDHLA